MPRTKADSEGVYFELSRALAADMKALAERNGRSFRDEMTSAVKRHLATPPVVVPVEPPALAAELVPAGQKPRRGRPKTKVPPA